MAISDWSMENRKKPSKKAAELSFIEDQKLLRHCEALVKRWERGEPDRRKQDAAGWRLYTGRHTLSVLPESKLAITSNTVRALGERVAGDVLRGKPTPEISAKNEEDDNAARLLEGAVIQNWSTTRMEQKLANAYRLAMFTRQVGFYHYWREDLNDGIGDVDKEFLAGHQIIFDDKRQHVEDMEYVGFEKPMKRSKLITLYPDKANAIEEACDTSQGSSINKMMDPLASSYLQSPAGLNVVDRLVTTAASNVPPYSPVSSIPANFIKSKDPLSEEVMVRYLWIKDYSVKMIKQPRIDPSTHKHVWSLDYDEEGNIQFDEDGHEIVDTVLGPQYVPKISPRMKLVEDDALVRKYPKWRHVCYIKGDMVKLFDTAWNIRAPISIVRDRYPAWGFNAEGSALALQSISAARNVMWTITFGRLRKSLRGTWLTTPGNGVKRNKLTNELGAVFNVNNINDIKEFPSNPLEPGNFQILQLIEQEMETLMGVTPMMQGKPVGRADSPQTYEQVADLSGSPILDRAKLIDQFIRDAVSIDMEFIQNYYTHEHVVEHETEIGWTTWTQASALAMRGSFALNVTTGSTLSRSASRDRVEAEENAQAGFYALPMVGKMGHVKNYKQALKQKAAIMALGPQYAFLLGSAGAPPNTQAQNIRAKTQRSHHKPGGK